MYVDQPWVQMVSDSEKHQDVWNVHSYTKSVLGRDFMMFYSQLVSFAAVFRLVTQHCVRFR